MPKRATTISRNAQLADTCRRILGAQFETGAIDMLRMAREASMARPESYNVSFEYARRMVRFAKAHPQECGRLRRASLWKELRRKVDARMAATGESDSDALMHILLYGRPDSFHLSEHTVKRLYERERHARHVRRPLGGNARQALPTTRL